jgi:phosphoglycerate dehydrogenase-like enzyme
MIIISRGGIVNEEALASALRNETIMEAAVDCYVTEPLPSDHYFFDVPNLIMTPHMSGVVDNYWPILFGLIVENLGRFKDEERLFNQVNSKVGY